MDMAKGKSSRTPKGSQLLGDELRRLRAGRRLADIAELTRRSPLARRIRPVSVPTLSQVENGAVLPSLETLYSLAIVYGVSATALLNLLAEERLLRDGRVRPPADLAAHKNQLEAALTEGRWEEALALAWHGERAAASNTDAAVWRSYRSMALASLGMRHDAMALLNECLATTGLSAGHAHVFHRLLARVLADSGFVAAASLHAGEAVRLAPPSLPQAHRLILLQTQVFLVLRKVECEQAVSQRELRDAAATVATARALVSVGDRQTELLLDLYQARIEECLGNLLVAGRDYQAVAAAADENDHPRLAVDAWLSLGALRRRQGRLKDARTSLLKAENRAVESQQPDAAFEAYLELYLVACALDDPKAGYYLKRCHRYLPLVGALTPSVRRFESMCVATSAGARVE